MNEIVKKVQIVHQAVLTTPPFEYVTAHRKYVLLKLANVDLVCYNVMQYPSLFLKFFYQLVFYAATVFRRRVHHPYIFTCFCGNFCTVLIMFHLASLACLGYGI